MNKLPSDLKSLLDYFYQFERERANKVYLRQPFGNNWKEITWFEVGQEARRLCTALQNSGLQKGDHVGILSKNCYHWFITDIAILMGGFVSVPFYPNLNKEQLNEVLALSDVKTLFVGKLDAWSGFEMKNINVIRFPHYDGNAQVNEGIEWNDFLANHPPMQGYPDIDFEAVYTILFTSGTTGTPKGVMLPYKSPALLMHNQQKHDNLGIFDGKPHHFLSYLPLNHIAERIIVEYASIFTGATVSFAQSLDTFAKNLKDVQPTIFMSVPRLWTKFRLAIWSKLPQKRLDLLLKIPIINNIIKNSIKKGLGLSKARAVLTGAAPTPDNLKDWYKQFDITLQEVYGMTENCAGCTLMPKNAIKSGTVGKPLPEVQIKIDEETNEIIMNVPWMMKAYYNNDEKSNEVLKDGWLHTGDQGQMDDEGYLKVTGRVKDTFKTAKGKFIVPAPMEWKFSKSQWIENIAVVGRGVSQPLALVNLSENAKDEIKADIETDIIYLMNQINQDLASFQKIKTCVIINEMWTIENGILTPTMKIKRNELNKRFEHLYETWHDQNEEVIWY